MTTFVINGKTYRMVETDGNVFCSECAFGEPEMHRPEATCHLPKSFSCVKCAMEARVSPMFSVFVEVKRKEK